MDELEAGKEKFLELVRACDPEVEVVIPTTPSRSLFLISLTKGPTGSSLPSTRTISST